MKHKGKWVFLPLPQKLKWTLLCLSILVSSVNVYAATNCATVTEIPQVECEALIAFYDSTSGDSWTNKTDWNVTSTPCSWTGITCSNGYVTKLELGSNQLYGRMPSELGNLTKLQRLNLYNNQLVGTIPTELGNMSSLQFLILGNNQLTGSIPTGVGNLINLKNITLSSNQLAGTIPSGLSDLTRLTSLRLDYNQFNGAIPDTSALTRLSVFELVGNSLCKDETVNYGFWNSRVSVYPVCTLDSDLDGDGIIDGIDNCPSIYNSGQLDSDNDTIGEGCEPDTDGDNVIDDNDAFFLDSSESKDTDGDSIGDNGDNCPSISNLDQLDMDGNGIGDVCDPTADSDGDGIMNDVDNCLTIANSDQADTDGDNIGDVCDDFTDSDNDGIANDVDNCPFTSNADQVDTDGDNIGDACDDFTDSDGDDVADDVDNCPSIANSDQADTDDDGIGDACDTVDTDGDGIADDVDNCPSIANSDQADSDENGIGDVCDTVDTDADGIADDVDNCPSTSNADQADSDGNGIGDACELFPIYRFWFPLNKTHFFTMNENEKDNIINTFPTEKYQYGGVAYYAYKAGSAPEGTSPVYRFWFTQNKTHFFTMNENEKDNIINTFPTEKYQYGGVAWYAYKASDAPEGTSPVYRFWFTQNKTHFYTMNENEKDNIINTFPPEKFQYGGVAWYAYK